MCRFPAFETGSVDRTAGACRRGPAEPELPPANGGVPLILAMACGYLGTGNAADRPSTAGPADTGRTVTPIRTAGGGNPAVLSPLSPPAVPLSLKLDMVRSQTVGLDEFIARWIGRLRRRPYTGPPGPPDRLRPSAGL